MSTNAIRSWLYDSSPVMLTMVVEYLVDFTHVSFRECFVQYVRGIRWHQNFIHDVLDSVVSGASAVALSCASLARTDR